MSTIGKMKALILLSLLLLSSCVYGNHINVAVGSVVKLQSLQDTDRGYLQSVGTGFFVQSKDTLITAAHVILNEDGLIPIERLKIEQIGHQKNTSAKITELKALSLVYDLAVLKVESYNGPVLAPGELITGEEVYALGFPEGELNTIAGSHVQNWYTNYEFINNSVSKPHGSSGSPVLNSKGQVIGIMSESSFHYKTAKKIIYLQRLLQMMDITTKSDKNDKLFHKELKNIHQLAGNGDKIAQLQLCKLYQHGRGVKKDPVQSFTLCLLAAQLGHAEAQMILGNIHRELYEEKPNEEIHDKESTRWYKRSALQGYRKAAFKLGIIYLRAGDYDESRIWFLQAEDNGDPEALHWIELLDKEPYLHRFQRWLSPYLPDWT